MSGPVHGAPAAPSGAREPSQQAVSALRASPPSAWTPGPWQLYHDEYEPLRVIGNVDGPDDGRYHYSNVVEEAEGNTDAEARANARLIAAAPELYAALMALEPHLGAIIDYASTCGEHEPNLLAKNATAALSKARGEVA